MKSCSEDAGDHWLGREVWTGEGGLKSQIENVREERMGRSGRVAVMEIAD